MKKGLSSTYDFSSTYQENLERGPGFEGELPPLRETFPRACRLLDFELASPFGIPAGLLLDSRWISLYARLGFDLLTYKTVRTRRHESLPFPNCLFVEPGSLLDPAQRVPARPLSPEGKRRTIPWIGEEARGDLRELRGSTGEEEGPPVWQLTPVALPPRLRARLQLQPRHLEEITITNSFGMPSRDPSVWQADMERSKSLLQKGQILIASVVGSSDPREGLSCLAEDYVRCAMLAQEAGADIIELNYSCPNSSSREGALYADPETSSHISRRVQRALRGTPLFLKVGYFPHDEPLDAVVRANAPFVQGIVGINSVKLPVAGPDGEEVLPGRSESGICGAGIRRCGLDFVGKVAEIRKRERYDFVLVGVGGVMTPRDIEGYLAQGADAVQSCTGAMWNPYLAQEWHKQDKF